MFGEITKQGVLMIGRAGFLKECVCPKMEGSCGDHCALFNEPFKNYNKKTKKSKFVVKICEGKMHLFSEFSDKRYLHEEAPMDDIEDIDDEDLE